MLIVKSSQQPNWPPTGVYSFPTPAKQLPLIVPCFITARLRPPGARQSAVEARILSRLKLREYGSPEADPIGR
jgi:hypothetical protein